MSVETKQQYASLLDKTWGNLAGAIDTIGRIQVMAQKDFVGDSGLLFTLVSQPESYSPGRSSLAKAGLISIALALLLSAIYTLSQLFVGKAFAKSAG